MKPPEKAQHLVEHLRQLKDFVILDYMDGMYGHMGATISDAILQAGTNYDRVVRPRIQRIRDAYPEVVTSSAFQELIDVVGIKQILSWQDDEKPNRVIGLTKFLITEGIETESDLKVWLMDEANRPRLIKLRGVKEKTADYLKILVGIQTAAADRYVFRLLEEADAPANDYAEAREILNCAADEMHTRRALFDHSVWQYMSKRKS